LSAPGNEDEDRENIEKRAQTVYEAARRRFEDERERTRRLDDNARSLVGSILVVIGFLLAAGTISRVNLESFSSIFYFLGIITLVSSVVCAYLAFRYKAGAVPKMMILSEETSVDFKEIVKKEYDYEMYKYYVDKACKVPFEEICKKLAVSNLKMVNHNMGKNIEKGQLIYVTWILMVIGLLMVTLFVLTSIIWASDRTEDNENATRTNVDGVPMKGDMLTFTVAVPSHKH
jgi:hypothetical protein